MANRFGRFNLDFEENEDERDNFNGEDGDSFDPSLSLSSISSDGLSGSSTIENRRPSQRRFTERDKFKVYANPFDRKNKRGKKSKRKKRNEKNRGASATSVTVVVPPPTSASAAGSAGQQSTAEWNPCSISEDVEVFRRYGVDPKYSNHDGEGCYGCNVQCDAVPVKQSNMKVLLEKIAQSGVNSGNVLARAETIRSNYLDLIVEPKRKLNRLLTERSSSSSTSAFNTGTKRKSSFRSHRHHDGEKEEECECECDSTRPNKSRRLGYGSSTKDLTMTTKEKEDDDDENGISDEWNTLKIYNHLKQHQMNVIEQVQYRRTQLWNIMNEMDRNSIFIEHGTKLNVFGEKLRRVDPDQFKIYLLAHREWLALSKSRPDLMRPFYDPDKVNSQGTANSREGEGNIINVSGQLLFGKKKR